MIGFILALQAAAALAQDTDEMFPGEREILEQIEQEDLREAEAEAAAAPEAGTLVVTPLDTSGSMESLREQGESYFDVPGSLVIEPEAFESIEDGAFPVPEVSPPAPVDETAPE